MINEIIELIRCYDRNQVTTMRHIKLSKNELPALAAELAELIKSKSVDRNVFQSEVSR